MSISKDLIIRYVKEIIRDRSDLFVTEVKIKPDNSIYVFMDGDNGVNVDDCIKISKYVENHLDRSRCDFELNVSSYGIGRPFQLLRQYRNAIGRMVSVKFEDGTKIKGKLIDVDEKVLHMEVSSGKRQEPSVTEIPMFQIKEAKEEVTF